MDQADLARLARFQLLRPYLRELLLEELLGEMGLDAEEFKLAQGRFLEENGLNNQQDLLRYCQDNGLSDADLQYRIAYPMRLWKYARQRFGARAESHFLARKQSLDKVVYSLLRNKDLGLVRELYLQVREGEAEFADLAAEHAEGPERATRGVVGPVPLNQGHPELVDRLVSAQPGVLLEPFAIEDWWVLVRLESQVPATYGPQAAEVMTRELLDTWLEEQVDLRMQSLAQEPVQVSS